MRTVRVLGACLVGTGAELVTVEARFEARDTGPTEVSISGLPDPVIRESRGRWMCALKEARLALRPGHLFLNLVPAARRKTGGTLDLALAVGAAAASGHLEPSWLDSTLFLGELGIDGRLHPVPGGLAAAAAARSAGVRRLVAPAATAREAAWIEGVEACAVRGFKQVVRELSSSPCALERLTPEEEPHAHREDPLSLDEVRGQPLAKRALTVAAAGGHALLLCGPPGAGKSMLARRLGSLLAAPSLEERIEISRVLSAVGSWPGGLARARPFRAPHHTTSFAGLVGGGSPPTPGEITLAHRGVLFLDELPEFRREALEALRQPLESGDVTVSRAGARLTLPARFQLVAAMNPCPCGFRGHPHIPCHCGPAAVMRYRRRISGPLLDRIELRLELQPPELSELLGSDSSPPEPPEGERHAELVSTVERARTLAATRQAGLANAQLSVSGLDRHARLDLAGRTLLERCAARGSLSARALQAVRRVARTLADLDGSPELEAAHVAEALGLRGGLALHEP